MKLYNSSRVFLCDYNGELFHIKTYGYNGVRSNPEDENLCMYFITDDYTVRFYGHLKELSKFTEDIKGQYEKHRNTFTIKPAMHIHTEIIRKVKEK